MNDDLLIVLFICSFFLYAVFHINLTPIRKIRKMKEGGRKSISLLNSLEVISAKGRGVCNNRGRYNNKDCPYLRLEAAISHQNKDPSYPFCP